MPSEILQETNLNSPTSSSNPEEKIPTTNNKPDLPARPPPLPARRELPPVPARPPTVAPKAAQVTRQDDHDDNTSYLSHKTSYVPRKFNFQAQNDLCTGCKKAVYAAELVLGAGNKYHKACLKCCTCGKRLDSTSMVDHDFDLYCRACHSKAFGPKGFGYGNLLSTEGATR